MTIIEDKAQQEDKHLLKHNWWKENGIAFERFPLPAGDYIVANEKVMDVIQRKQERGIEVKKMDFLGTYTAAVDTKKDMQEIAGNICGKQHPRFRDECILAQNNGIKLYVLVENAEGVTSIDDVFQWRNPRLERYNKVACMHSYGKWLYITNPKKPPTSGKALAKAMLTMQLKYGVEFVFCGQDEAGAKVIELLTK